MYLAASLLALSLAAADPPAGGKPGPVTDAKLRVFGSYWMEVRREDAKGVTVDPFKLFCFNYDAGTIHCWLRRGELTEGSQAGDRVIIRAEAEPMQIDFVYLNRGQEYATPAIFQFDGRKLVIAEPTTPSAVKLRQDGVYANRPTDFTADKKNKYLLRTLVPCNYLDQD